MNVGAIARDLAIIDSLAAAVIDEIAAARTAATHVTKRRWRGTVQTVDTAARMDAFRAGQPGLLARAADMDRLAASVLDALDGATQVHGDAAGVRTKVGWIRGSINTLATRGATPAKQYDEVRSTIDAAQYVRSRVAMINADLAVLVAKLDADGTSAARVDAYRGLADRLAVEMGDPGTVPAAQDAAMYGAVASRAITAAAEFA